MAEFNPYKLEEEKWTPNNVYEILPPNAVSWSDYDFGQGTDNVDREAASKSLIDGFVDFFKELFGTAGKILGGAVELGGAILGGFVNGVIGLIGGIANAIGSIFGGGNTESPNPPLFNPIKTNLEAAIQPHRDKIDESWRKTEEILAEQEVLRGQMSESLQDMRDARDRANEAIEKSGQSIAEAQAASAAAETARQTLEAYNTELNQRITTEFNAAVGRADTAVAKADTLAGELAAFKAQHQLEIDVAVGKAEQAVADLATLTPQVESALAESSAANQKVADLTPQVSDAVTKAGAAVSKADQTLADYTAWAAAQKTRIDSAVSKAEKATSDLASLSPKVADAVAKSEAATDNVATLTSDVEVTQATADKALADLQNLSIGGRNLLQRVDPVTLSTYQQIEDTGEVFWTGEPIYKGTKLSTGTPPTQISRGITFEPGDEYTASVWVKGAELVNSKMSANLLFYSVEVHATGYSEGDGTQWLRVSTTWKNDTPDPVLIRFYFYLNRNPGELTYFTSPQVERGNVVTDWTPPIEDFTAEFSDIREDLNRKYTEALSEAKVAVNALPGLNDQMAEIGDKAEQGIADAKAVNDKLPSITQQVTDLTTGQGDLAEGLSKAATQEDYNTLNTAFQQEQVKINNLNASFQEEQTKLNTLSSDFQAYQSDLNLKQQEWNLGAQRSLTALEEIAAVQKEVNSNNTAFQDFQLGVNEDRVKWEQGATLAISNLTDFSAKQTKWNAAVDRSIATQKTVNDNFKKWTDGATTAIEANTKAIALLSAPQGASSIVPIDPLTKEPYYLGWAGDRISVANIDSVPTRMSVKYTGTASKRFYAPSDQLVPVKVARGQVYRWVAWTYSNVANSAMMLYLRDPATGTGSKATTHDKESKTSGHTPHGLYLRGIPSGWNKVSGTITFQDEISSLEFYSVNWNQSGLTSSVTQYITGFDIAPDVPTQAQVDAAQNKAIETFDLFMGKQDEWNAGTTAALDAQKKVDDNFKKWSDGAAEAIEANKNAIKALNAPQMGTSVIPLMPGTQTPAWAANANGTGFNDTNLKDGDHTWYRFDQTQGPGSHNMVAVDSSLEYDFSVWIHGTGDSVLYVEMRDQNGEHAVQSGTITSYTENNSSKYLIENMKLSVGWKKLSTTITLNPGVKFIKIDKIYGNHSNGGDGSAYLADMRMVPHVPTQKSVDDAQNEAISANTEALKALGKKSLGASLVPYKTPSTQEVKDYAAGKLDYDPWADPEYFDAGYSLSSNATYGRYTRAGASDGTKSYNGTLVSVDSSIEYRVKFDAYAYVTGSILVVAMQDQNGSTAVQSTSVRDQGTMAGTSYPIHYLTLKQGWHSYSGRIKFKPTTTSARLSTFYWNHPNGASGTQALANLEIVPDIPDANVVNELQDNAIRKNTAVGSDNKKAIEALRDGLDASIELSTVNDLISQLETRIHEEEKARGRLQRRIDDLQNEMIPRTIVRDDATTYDDYVDLSGRKVTAKPGWVGQMAITYKTSEGYGTSSDPARYETHVTRKSVPDGTTRSWTLSGSVLRIDYWIYQGKAKSIELENSGGFFTGSVWEKSTERTIASHKVGKTYGTGKIEWKTQLKNANRGTTYRLIVRVTGQADKTYTWSSVGPLTGLGSGTATLKFDYEFNLPDNATVSIVAYTNGSTAYRTMVNYSSGTLTYVEKK